MGPGRAVVVNDCGHRKDPAAMGYYHGRWHYRGEHTTGSDSEMGLINWVVTQLSRQWKGRRQPIVRLFLRRLIGAITHRYNPRYSTCGRCNRPWNIAQKHDTSYHQSITGRDAGCFPLCEQCWGELTIERRIPYYSDLWNLWLESPPMNETWEDILIAVEGGG